MERPHKNQTSRASKKPASASFFDGRMRLEVQYIRKRANIVRKKHDILPKRQELFAPGIFRKMSDPIESRR
jgi:hypothetical protein